MAYIKNTWTDQNVERPRTYDMQNNSDGSVTLIDSFGMVTDLGTPVNADNMNHIENGISNVGIWQYDSSVVYAKDDAVISVVDNKFVLYKSLKDQNLNNPLSDKTSWEEVNLGGGSGLEICDIGIALYVDETKGLRRRLNGSIMDITSNYQAFLTRLKEITTLYPSLVCTESEWQTIKTMSKLGQCGKFVYNYGADGTTVTSIRLPLVININGLVDMANAGLIKDESLPNIKGGVKYDVGQGSDTDYTGAISLIASRNNPIWQGATNVNRQRDWDFNASRVSSTYQDNASVQQEAIQYPYFIQIATGSETENNIINEIELNNPYSLFDSKYSDHELNNLSWLKSEGQWNAKAVYQTAYDKLLKVYNGTETVEGLSVKLSTETYTDYDFVLNTTEETFRLPLKTKLASGKAVVGNGISIGITDGTTNAGLFNATDGRLENAINLYGTDVGTDKASGQIVSAKSLGLTTDPTKSGMELDDSNLYLYYYVGETVQNANLIDAGRIGEALVDKINYAQGARAGMPSKRYDDLTVLASGQTYTAPADGYFAFDCLATSSTCSILMVNQDTFYAVGSGYSNNSYMAIASSVPAKKGEKVSLEYRDCTPIYFRFIYADGVANT